MTKDELLSLLVSWGNLDIIISAILEQPGYMPLLMDFCLNCFTSQEEPVSVRVYALQILFNISELEPGFKPELISLIDYESELHPSPGVKAKGKNLLKILMKQIK